MTNHKTDSSERLLRRPFDHFRREPTPADLTRIAANPKIRPQRIIAMVAPVIAGPDRASIVAGT